MGVWPSLLKLKELADLRDNPPEPVPHVLVATHTERQTTNTDVAQQAQEPADVCVGRRSPVPSHRGCRPRPLAPDALAQAINRYQSGETLRAIAADCGFSRGFLTAQFRKAGVDIRLRRITAAEIRIAAYEYGTGKSLVAVGESLGFNAKTIWLALRAAGVPMRDPHRHVQ